MADVYPLRFGPLFRRYLWGGRRLATRLGKPIGEEGICAESWEVVDHGEDQSVVAAGPLAGRTLRELITEDGRAILGRHHPQPRFPLLLKFLDAQKTLSVQVHPDDQRAARLDPPDLGKTEAWVVIDAEPGSVIYAGLKRGFDRHALEREVRRGTCNLCLNRIAPQPGDCIFIPAGVVHAIGEGLLVAEIQQSSDTTYRLFDWNRLDAEGNPRALHIEAALDAIDYDYGPAEVQQPQPTQHAWISRLVACEKFVLDRWDFDQPQTIGGDDRMHLIAVLDGSVNVQGDPIAAALSIGGTVLIPAACGPTLIHPKGQAVLLDIYLP